MEVEWWGERAREASHARAGVSMTGWSDVEAEEAG